MCKTVNWLCWFAINLVINKISVLAQYNVPANSCPQYFEYINNGNEIEGQIKLRFKITDSFVKILFEATVPTQLTSSYVGAIELINSKNTVALDIREGRPLLYRVKFPLRDVIPQVTAIYYNNNLLCSGPVSKGTYTGIRLNYDLDTRGAGGNSNVNYVDREPAPPPPQQTQYQPSLSNPNQALFENPQQTTPSQTFVYNTKKTRKPPTIPSSTGLFNPSDDSVCGSSVTSSVSLIKGGSHFQKGDWPWLAALHHFESFICGGSIISSKHVLSAAHCIQDKGTAKKNERDVHIIVGLFHLTEVDDSEQTIDVNRFIIHPDWNPNSGSYDADISLIVLKSLIKYTNYVRPICLPSSQEANQDVTNREGAVAGWGYGDDNKISNLPKIVSIPIVTEATCLRSDHFYASVTSGRTFCAGGRNGEGPCNGDSGGGLMLKNFDGKWMIRGIVSSSKKDVVSGGCDTLNYLVFTDTGKFMSWIRSNMN